MKSFVFIVLCLSFSMIHAQNYQHEGYTATLAGQIISGGAYTSQVIAGEAISAQTATSDKYVMQAGLMPLFIQYISITGDSLALVALFENTGGNSWVNKTGWLQSANLNDWFGVNIEKNRVVSVLLPNNGLINSIPEEILSLAQLKRLDINGNMIENIPVLSNIGTLDTLNVSNNQLVFADLLPLKGIEVFDYAPQNQVGENSVDIQPVHSQVTFNSGIVDAEKYTWTKNGIVITTPTGENYSINDLEFANQGVYQVSATHSALPELTLQSGTFEIMATANINGTADRSDNQTPIVEGEAFLYQITNEGPFPETQKIELDASGNFLFDEVLLNDYLVLVKPDSIAYPDLVNTYYAEKDIWYLADTLFLRDNENMTVSLISNPGNEIDPNNSDATGALYGIVEEEFEGGKNAARKKVSGTGISVSRSNTRGRDFENELVAYTLTNEEGQFAFTSIPAGVYYLFIDYPGIDLAENATTEFVYDENFTGKEYEIAALVTEDGIAVEIVSETGLLKPLIDDLSIFPNPITQNSVISYQVKRPVQALEIQWIDAKGAVIYSEEINQQLGFHEASTPYQLLSKGVYHVQFIANKHEKQGWIRVNK